MLTAENEALLLAYAKQATAGQLERLLRGYKTVHDNIEDQTAADPEKARRARRWLSWYWDDDGMLVLQARLPAEEGALLLQALQMADASSADGPAEATDPTEPGVNGETPPTERADVSAESPSTDGGDVSAESPRWGRVADDDGDDWSASPLVLTDADGEVICVGAPSDDADDGWAEEALPTPPPTSGGGARWADALVAVADSALAAGPTAGAGGVRPEILVHLDLDLLLGGDADPTGGAACHLDDGPSLSSQVARRLACDCGLRAVVDHGPTGATLEVGGHRYTPTAAQRVALWARDGGCRFPGCQQRRFVDAHHIVHWIDGGPTHITNLLLLCRHHHGIVHSQGWAIQQPSPRAFVFIRPDGIPAQTHDIGSQRLDLAAANRAAGIDPSADALCAQGDPTWFDIHDAVQAILTADHIPLT